MICFIASAFDHDDVDSIYQLAIRPVLKSLKIDCVGFAQQQAASL
jgi:hypothetical protein